MRTTIWTTALLALLLLAGCGKKAPVPTKSTKSEKPKAEETKPAAAESLPLPTEGALADALKKAKADGKNLLVEYYDVTCQYCTQMDEEVYPDEFVKDALGQVVYVRLHRDKDAAWFEKRWGRKATPTFVVLTPEGDEKGEPLTGFLGAGALTDLADWAANPEGDMPSFEPGGS